VGGGAGKGGGAGGGEGGAGGGGGGGRGRPAHHNPSIQQRHFPVNPSMIQSIPRPKSRSSAQATSGATTALASLSRSASATRPLLHRRRPAPGQVASISCQAFRSSSNTTPRSSHSTDSDEPAGSRRRMHHGVTRRGSRAAATIFILKRTRTSSAALSRIAPKSPYVDSCIWWTNPPLDA